MNVSERNRFEPSHTKPYLSLNTMQTIGLKYLFPVIVILANALSSIGQNRASIMCMGNAAVDFRTEPPTIITSGMQGNESSSSICSESGELLFYSNGGESPLSAGPGGVWNANHQIMENGLLEDSSGCFSSNMGSVIIPQPSIVRSSPASIYYLFTRDCLESTFSPDGYNSGLTYSIINMDGNNGLGTVVEKNIQVVSYGALQTHSTGHEPLAVIQHSNEIDYWLFSYRNDSIYSVLIGEDGISSFRPYQQAIGPITISPISNFLIAGLDLFHLDNENGDLVWIMELGGSSAFSPSGQFLYVREGNKLFQYHLGTTDLPATKTEVGTVSEQLGMFLASNAKIYLYERDFGFRYVINCPNQFGPSCDVQTSNISIPNGNFGFTHTNILANYLFNPNDNCFVGIPDSNMNKGVIEIDLVGEQTYRVKLPHNRLSMARVFDAYGQEIYWEKRKTAEFNVTIPKLASGIYFLQILSESEKAVKKFVVR